MSATSKSMKAVSDMWLELPLGTTVAEAQERIAALLDAREQEVVERCAAVLDKVVEQHDANGRGMCVVFCECFGVQAIERFATAIRAGAR